MFNSYNSNSAFYTSRFLRVSSSFSSNSFCLKILFNVEWTEDDVISVNTEVGVFGFNSSFDFIQQFLLFLIYPCKVISPISNK